MWLRSIFLKTLGDSRIAILAWGLGIGAIAPLIFTLVPTLLADSEARASVLALTRHPAIRVFAEPVDVLTPAGYATWRLALILPLLGIWALLATSRSLRGEEESGALDLLLSLPRSRFHVATAKLLATGLALVLIGGLIGIAAFAGGQLTGAGISLTAAMLFGLNAALLASVFGGCALLVSQFTRGRRSAAGFTGVLLGLSVMMTSAGRAIPSAEWVGRLSPLYYFERSKPLVNVVDPLAMLTMAALAAVMSVAGVALFLCRDVGGHIAVPVRRQPGIAGHGAVLPLRSPLLQSLFTQSLAALAVPLASWGLALAVYTGGMTAILQQAQRNLFELLESVASRGPMYAELVARLTGGRDATMNARSLTAIFTIVAVLVAGLAVTLASRWASDEEEGCFDLLLATPHRRQHLILAHFAALAMALVVIAGLIFASTAVVAWMQGFVLDRIRLAEAALGMVPIGLVVAAAGYLLAGWLRSRSVTGILTGLLLGSFLVTLLGPLFHWPRLLMQLSIFEQYGMPLVEGLHPARVIGLLAFTAALLAIATVRFATKDLVR